MAKGIKGAVMLSSIIGLGSARFHTVNAGVVKDVKMAKVSF